MILREIVYMVLDELKVNSDDGYFEEEHIIFLIDKYRSFLLKQRYSDIKKYVSESNYQTICLDLIQVPAISGEPCEGGTYLRSKYKVPFPMNSALVKVSPMDYFGGEIAYVSRERLRYIGYNRFTKHLIYAAIGPDGYLYFKSMNPQFLYLEKAKMTGVFSDAKEAFELSCDEDKSCEYIDSDYPLENALVSPLIQLIVQELSGAVYRPKDDANNSKDDLTELNIQKSRD